MDENALGEGLIWLFASDCGLTGSLESDRQLRASCRQAIWDRLMRDEVDFRIWISRLVREMYLSDAALAAGHGIDEACEFWSWFDETMWTGVTPGTAQRPPTSVRPPLRPPR